MVAGITEWILAGLMFTRLIADRRRPS